MVKNSNRLSFIPKTRGSRGIKTQYKQLGGGLLFKISIFLIIVSTLAVAGTLLYRAVLLKQIDELTLSIERVKASFDPTLIEEIDKLASAIPVARQLLTEHRLPVKIFELLEETTLEKVRFLEFDYSYEPVEQSISGGLSRLPGQKKKEKEYRINVSLAGETKDYNTLAQQSQILSQNTKIKEFDFSNFSLTTDGDVSFNLQLILDPKTIFK
jgi:hypothetical protein